MYSALLDDIIQDIKDDNKFPHGGSKTAQLAYLKIKQRENPHIKEAVREYKDFIADMKEFNINVELVVLMLNSSTHKTTEDVLKFYENYVTDEGFKLNLLARNNKTKLSREKFIKLCKSTPFVEIESLDKDSGLEGLFESLAEPSMNLHGENLCMGAYYLGDGMYLTSDDEIVSEDDL